MVTSLVPNPAASSTVRKSSRQLAAEFRLLGLRPREARLDVIRGAVTETASDLKGATEWDANDSGRVAQVAVAGYRLLDPRRRGTLFERVQLLLWTDDDLEQPTASLWDVPVGSAGPQRVVASPVANPVAPPVSVPANAQATRIPGRGQPAAAPEVPVTASTNSSAEETQAALELFRSLRKRDRRAMALWVSIAALALSLVSTLGLVAALI